jgi:hypothetical protein
VTDPVKAIQTVKHRLARLAVVQTLTAVAPPLIVLAAVALGLRALGECSWERWGFMLAPGYTRGLQTFLLAATVLGLLASAIIAMLSYRRSQDAIAAAELIDRKLQCHQEVLTLATLADNGQSPLRSSLFPVLWRRAAEHLERLDPVRAFPFQIRPPLRQALFLTVCTVGLLAAGISVLLAANKPSPSADARELRRIAREIANSGTDAHSRELAEKLRAVANALQNPEVPPEIKLEQLASVEQQLKAEQQRQQREQRQASGSSNGTATGKGTKGAASGKETAGNGKQGEGKGNGNGSGNSNGSGKGSGANAGKMPNGEIQLTEARKDIAKLQAQLEAEAAKHKSPGSDAGGLKARAPRPGEEPNLAMLKRAENSSNNLNQLKSVKQPNQEPNPGREQSGQPRRDFGSSKGDTHLGEFPKPGNFERFYKAGEHGPTLDVKNARYVLFRIPPAALTAGGGKSVIDNERVTATVPYANLPLKEERIAADPDEHQLVPPRYRDLLR